MPTNGMRRVTDYVLFAFLFGITCRFACSVNKYSGEGKPPMFGDFEAQRHWMEVTIALPVEEWYTNSSFNDLQYWGLDYPPLTAYHSWIVGKIANEIDPAFVAPMTSRGYESRWLKTFMRSSVFVADIIFLSSIFCYYYYLCTKDYQNISHVSNSIFIALLYPPLILIDHGHFQYNCISLGLTVFAITYLFKNKIFHAAFFFTLALNYKQMSLYHSLPFFVYILRISLYRRTFGSRILFLLKVGLTVVITFAILWLPYLRFDRLMQVIVRIFPVARGIFEDKVANIWCTVNIFYKLNQHLSQDNLVKLCAVCTLLGSMPSLICLALRPKQRHFLLSLINVSFSFFLFSFHVHEKTILLVALPVMLHMHYDMFPSCWFFVISHVSLLHLAVKDNLLLPYSSLLAIFCIYLYGNYIMYYKEKQARMAPVITPSILAFFFIVWNYSFVSPPPKYPDLYPLLISVYSCLHFVGFYLYFNVYQIFLVLKTPTKPIQAKKLPGKKIRRKRRPSKVIQKQSMK